MNLQATAACLATALSIGLSKYAWRHIRAQRGSGGGSILNEPVLIIGFNRPDHLRQVLDCVRVARPPRVYLAIDGPRVDRPEDVAKVAACRQVAALIDWTDEVQTLFQERNLGCGRGVTTALDWFFQHESRGIILEDDIIPDESFWAFCSDMLTRFEDDDRVIAIGGHNPVPSDQISDPSADYRFTQIPQIWGWATWRHAWQSYEFSIPNWHRQLPLWQLSSWTGHKPQSVAYWWRAFQGVTRGLIDTWDYQLVFRAIVDDRVAVVPNRNLTRNIGFGPDATHTVGDRPQAAVFAVCGPFVTLPVEVDAQADQWMQRFTYRFGLRAVIYEVSQKILPDRLFRSAVQYWNKWVKSEPSALIGD